METEGKIGMTKEVARRDFMMKALLAWGTFVSLPFIYGVLKFVYPPIEQERRVDSISAGSIDDIPPSSARIVKFNKKPVVLVRTPQNQFKAFRANCTHLGCIVEYRADDNRFHCNCHGSIFDINGRNVRGPAQLPLEPLKVSLKDSQVILSQALT